MTKADIIDCVCEHVGGFSKKESADIVETVFDVMKTTLATRREDQDLRLRQLRRAREEAAARAQPADRHRDPIDARRVLTFKPSQVLKQALNPNG